MAQVVANDLKVQSTDKHPVLHSIISYMIVHCMVLRNYINNFLITLAIDIRLHSYIVVRPKHLGKINITHFKHHIFITVASSV